MSILRLQHARLEEVVDTLCTAFREYPVMRYVVGDAPDYEAGLRALVTYFTENRFARDYPVLGIESNGELAAAANINPPRPAPAPPAVQRRFRDLRDVIGAAGISRFEAFVNACNPLEPNQPHYYLGMIGVHPDHQGEGLGGVLLEAVGELSEADEESTGVCLTTETEDNLAFYERYRYRVLGEATTADGGLKTWTLFRDDED